MIEIEKNELMETTQSIFKLLVENIDEGIIILDEAGNLTNRNPVAEKMLSRHGEVGKPLKDILELLDPRDAEENRFKFEDTPFGRALKGERVINAGFSLETLRGRRKYEVKSIPIISNSRKIEGSISIITDITDTGKLKISGLKTRREEILNKIGRICNSTLNIDKLLAKIAKLIRDAMGSSSVIIFSPSNEHLNILVSTGTPQCTGLAIPLSDFFSAAKIMKSKKPLFVSPLKKKDAVLKELLDLEELKSSLLFPILLGNEIRGIIAVNFVEHDHGLSNLELALINNISYHIGIAIEKARLLEAQKRKTSELEVINLMSNEIISGLEINKLLDQTSRIISKLVPSDGGAVFTFNHFVKNITNSYFDLVPTELRSALTEEDGIIYRLIKTRKPLLVESSSKMQFYYKELFELGLRSFIGVPLEFENKAIGALCAVGIRKEHRFEKHDIDLFETLGRSISIAIKNSELFEEHQAISRTLQMSLLPKEAPQIEGMDVGVHYESATKGAMIGGDFYDFFKVSTDEYGIVVGDISGKGIEAAADSTLVKDILKGFAMEGYVLVDVMKHLNRWITRQFANDKFATLIYAVYNKTLSTLIYANAGHPYPLIYGSRRGFIRDSDLVIGVVPDQTFKLFSFRVEPDEIIVFYTDGLIEARHGKEIFGETRLLRTLKGIAPLSAQEIADNLCHHAAEFSGKELSDDILTVVFKKR